MRANNALVNNHLLIFEMFSYETSVGAVGLSSIYKDRQLSICVFTQGVNL